MKKFVSLLLVLCLLLNFPMGTFAATPNSETPKVFANAKTPPATANLEKFSDMVLQDHWAYDALTIAAETGLMQGDDNKIKPFDKITRAEMITMVLRALGLSDTNGRDLSTFEADISMFTDINKSDWYYNEMAMAYKLNLLNGISDTEMSPNGVVPREQAFAILCRMMKLDSAAADLSILNGFQDRQALSQWAESNVAAMIANGYVSGSAGLLNPSAQTTRQDFAQLMKNLFERNYFSIGDTAKDFKGQTIKGNFLISTDNFTLSNLTVNGDVVIGDGVGNGTVTLDHVTVNGRLIVRGGGPNSIYLKGSTIGTAIICKYFDGAIRIFGEDGSSVSYMEIPDGKDTIVIDCDVSNLKLIGDNLDIVVNGKVQIIDILGNNAAMIGSGSVDRIILEQGVTMVAIAMANTEVINNSGAGISVTGKDGSSYLVDFGMEILTDAFGNMPGSSDKPSTHGKTEYTVSFYTDGDETVEPIIVTEGEAMGDLPVPTRENAIFIGWFTDNGTFVNGVSPETIVHSDLSLYACYMDSTSLAQTDEQTMTSVMDVAPDYEITILSSDVDMTAEDVYNAITCVAVNEEESEFAGIAVDGEAGSFLVYATEGFSTGCSYLITLGDDRLTFADQVSSVRSFTIAVELSEPVMNLKLNSSLKAIPSTSIDSITLNGQDVDSIFSPLYTVGNGNALDVVAGTFVYSGDQELFTGDRLAIYMGTPPDERVLTEDYTDQPINYIYVSNIDGSTISYESADPSEVIFTPDVLPVNEADDQDGTNANGAITISIEDMTYTGEDFASMGLDESTTVDPGDFLAFYTGSMDTAESLIYARIASVENSDENYLISYEEVSETEVMESMDLSSSQSLNYEQLSSNIDIESAEASILQQVTESGFAQAAADYFIALAKADEETRAQVCELLGIKDFTVTTELDSSVSAQDTTPTVTVTASISKTLEHFTGEGLRGEITVTCDVKLGDDLKMVVSGTFVEEFMVGLSFASKTIWKYWYSIPYIYDYQVTANLTLVNYTYLSLDMSLYSEDEAWSDGLNIKDSIKALQKMTGGTGQVNEEVREFYELYQDMMSLNHDYFDLFKVDLCKLSGGVDPFHIIGYGLSVEFVVSMDIDVSLGTEFSYEKATRYSFTLKIRDKVAVSSQTNLVDERYKFTAYAMGTLGLRAGIRITVEVGLLDVSLDSVGISAEVGAYWQIWGFIYYELEHANNVTTTKYGGGCYMEIGIFLTVKFLAQVGDGKLVSYNKTLYDNSWPLWSAGSQYYTYDFNYVLTDDTDDIIIKGEDTSYTIPTSYYKMSQMDFKSGDVSEQANDAGDFVFSIKNDTFNAFTISDAGDITVTPPSNSDIALATLEIAWKDAPLSFTSVPVSRSFNLVWDNLDDSYSISFDSNGGGICGSIQMPYGMPIGLPDAPRIGYHFEGWYTDNGTFTNRFTQMTMPATNMTLYAKWSPMLALYYVRHYLQNLDGSGYLAPMMDLLHSLSGSTVTPDFLNGDMYEAFTPPASKKTITVAGDGTAAAEYYYTRNSYTLTFDPNNGMKPIVSILKAGTEIVQPSVSKPGYDFVWWSDYNDNRMDVPDTMGPEDLSFKAQWSIRCYGLVCDLRDGSYYPGFANPTGYTINDGAITLNNPKKTGYSFVGWTGTGLTGTTKTVTIPTGSTGNRYYAAVWLRN